MLATTAFYAPLHALQNGIGIIADLDAAMTDLKKVTDETDTTYRNFLSSAHDIGNNIANTTSNVVRSATEWARLGYSIQQAQTLAEQTLVYQNVGDIKSAEDASKSLISAIKGFGIEVDNQGKNITKIVDVYNEVGNKYAISSAGIGEALRRSASSMYEAGVTLEEGVALATAANSTIQDPARVGQMLKTVSMRLRGVSEDGEDLSNLIPSLEKKFQAIGLTLKKDENTFKNTYEIFQDLSSVWGKLTDMQRAAILEDVAGKLQGNLAASLINNFKDAQDSLQTALNSTGSAAKENATFIDSIAGRVALFKNAVEGFWTDSINSDTIKGLIDTATSLVDQMGNLNGVLAFAISLFAAFKTKGIIDTTVALFNSIKAMKSTTTALFGLKAAANGTQAAFSAMNLAVGAGVFIAIVALTKLADHIRKTKQEQKEFEDQQKQIASNYSEHGDKITELVSRYEDLNKATNDGKVFANIEQEQEYKDLVEELANLMPNLVDKIDEKGQSHLKNAEAIKEELAYARQLADLDEKQTVLDAESNFKTSLAEVKKFEKEIASIAGKLAVGGVTINGGMGASSFVPYSESEINKFQSQIVGLQREVSTRLNLVRGDVSNLVQSILSINGIKIDSKIANQIENITKDLSLQGLKPEEIVVKSYAIAEFAEALYMLSETTDELRKGNREETVRAIGNSLGITSTKLQELVDAANSTTSLNIEKPLNELAQLASQAVDGILPLADAVKLLNSGLSVSEEYMTIFTKSVSASKDEIDILNKAQKELKDKGQLSAKTVEQISEKYKDFVAVTGLSTQEIYKFITAEKQKKEQIIETEIEATKKAIEMTTKRIELMRDEYSVTMALISAKQTLTSDDLRTEQNAITNIRNANSQLEELLKKYNLYVSTLSDFRFDDDANNKSNESLQETNEILTEQQKRLKELKSAIEDLQSKRTQMRKGSQEYRDSLAKENKLIKEQIELNKEGIKNPSKLVSTKQIITTKSGSSSLYDSGSNVDNMISAALGLQGSFTYKQVPGKFNGSYDDFVNQAISDCSQFVQEMFKQYLNVDLPRTAAEQAKQGVAIQKSELQSGDLVYFNTTGKSASHIGIYTGNGKFVQMGNSGLKEADMNSSYWASKYEGARRVSSDGSAGTTTVKNGNKTIKTQNASAQDLQDAADAARKENLNLENQLFQNSLELLDSVRYKYERLIAAEEATMTASQRKQDTFDPNSSDWRHENNVQINAQTRIQDLQHALKKNLESMMKELGVGSDDYDDYLKQLSSDWLDVQAEKNAKVIDNLNSQIELAKDSIEAYGRSISNSQQRMSHLEQGTANYNKELEFQIETAKKQESANSSLIKFYEAQIKNTKLSAASIKILNDQLEELKSQDYAGTIKELNAELVESQKSALSKTISDLTHELDLSRARMKDFEEGTAGYNDEAKNQIVVYRQLIEENKKLIAFTEAQIKNEALSAAERAKHREDLKDLILTNYDYAQSIKAINEQYADRVISDYKKMLQQQKDLELSSFDERMKAEDERHQNVMKHYDDEMKKFEDDISARIKALDRLNASEDHEDDLDKLLKEREEVQNNYNTILNNDSYEDKAKRQELLEQLAKIDEDIAKKQKDRGRQLQKDALQDQLEDRKDFIDKQTSAENEGYNDRKKALEKEKSDREKYWSAILEDERRFFNLKSQLMSEDSVTVQSTLATLRSEYDTFFSFLNSKASTLGDMFSTITSNFKNAYGNLDTPPNVNLPNVGSGGSNGNSNNTSPNKSAVRDSAWQEYLNNKKQAETIGKQIQSGVSKQQEETLRKEVSRLSSINSSYRQQYGFVDGSYDQLKNLSVYHDGGEVGVPGTTTQKWWNKILKSNEVPAILKKKEVVLDEPIKFINDLAMNIMGNIASISPSVKSLPRASDGGTTIERIDVTLTGQVKDGDDFADKLVGGLRRKGIRVR